MRSPVASTDNRARGFTLLELMLVISLFTLAAAALYPLGKTFYDRYVFRDTHTSLRSVLETASLRSLTGLRDRDHGVKILSDSYVLFEGSSYAARTSAFDSEFPVPEPLEVTGPDEFVFTGGSGAVSATGTIGLHYLGEHATITVHAPGIID